MTCDLVKPRVMRFLSTVEWPDCVRHILQTNS